MTLEEFKESLTDKQQGVFIRNKSISLFEILEIIKFITKHFKIEPIDIFLKSRKSEIKTPRMWVCYFLITGIRMNGFEVKFSSVDLGKFFKQDHSSILYSRDVIKAEIKFDKKSLLLFHHFDTNIRVILNKNRSKNV